MENGTLNLVSRETFMDVLIELYGNDTSSKKINQIYSSFDIYLTDIIDIRILIAGLRCFRNPTEIINEKIKNIFDIFDINKVGYIIEDDLYDLSTLLCITEKEKDTMESLCHNTFYNVIRDSDDGNIITFDDFCEAIDEGIDYTNMYQELLDLRLPKYLIFFN